LGEYFDKWEIEHPQWFVMENGRATFPYMKQLVEAIRDEDGNDVLKLAYSDVKIAKLISVAPKLLLLSYVLLALHSGGMPDSGGENLEVAYKALREVVTESETE
jgi:hypothetical protein